MLVGKSVVQLLPTQVTSQGLTVPVPVPALVMLSAYSEAAPVPARFRLSGRLVASLEIVMMSARAPSRVGVKVTLMLQL